MSSFLTLIRAFTAISITESQRYILYNTQSLTQKNADDMCLFYYDEHLASIHSISEQNEAQSLIQNQPTGRYPWVGLSDIVTENTWIWSDNTIFNYSLWGANEPNDANGDEDCVTLYLNGLWNDVPCNRSDRKYPSLCNYPKPISVINDKNSYVRIRGEGNLLGHIDILDEIYIEFFITFTSWATSQWSSILHCGNSDSYRLPAIYLENNAKFLQSTFQTIISWNPAISTTNALALNTEYHFSLYQTQRHLTITFDGSTIHDADTDSGHMIIMDQSLYLGHPWYNNPFGAALRNLKITTQNSPDNRYWNYICDWNNRWTSNAGGGYVFGTTDGDCSVRQNQVTASTAYVAWIGVNDITSLLWTDYKLEVKMRIISGVEAGPIFRANEANCDTLNCGQYYQLLVTSDKVRLCEINNALFVIDEYVIATSINTIYLWRIEAIGSTFKIYRNNEYLTTFTDDSFVSGSIGFKTYEADVRFSKYRVTFISNQQQYTVNPSPSPTSSPSNNPTFPTSIPSVSPTPAPTSNPTPSPTNNPTPSPTNNPTNIPTPSPTTDPIYSPTNEPTIEPITNPTLSPVSEIEITDEPINTLNNQLQSTNSESQIFMIILVFSSVVLGLCVIIIGLIIWSKISKRKSKEKSVDLNLKPYNPSGNMGVEIQRVISVSNMTSGSGMSEDEMKKDKGTDIIRDVSLSPLPPKILPVVVTDYGKEYAKDTNRGNEGQNVENDIVHAINKTNVGNQYETPFKAVNSDNEIVNQINKTNIGNENVTTSDIIDDNYNDLTVGTTNRNIENDEFIVEGNGTIDNDELSTNTTNGKADDDTRVWFEYVNKYGKPPQNAFQLVSFSNSGSQYKSITFKEATMIYNKMK